MSMAIAKKENNRPKNAREINESGLPAVSIYIYMYRCIYRWYVLVNEMRH